MGLPIVNEAYHAHDRALHFGTRCAAVLRQLYLCEFLELELHIRDSTCRRCLLTACAISAMRRQRARSNPPRPREIFESDMLQPVTCLREPDHILVIWTGVTIINQSGPNALKMILTSRIQKAQKVFTSFFETDKKTL